MIKKSSMNGHIYLREEARSSNLMMADTVDISAAFEAKPSTSTCRLLVKLSILSTSSIRYHNAIQNDTKCCQKAPYDSKEN